MKRRGRSLSYISIVIASLGIFGAFPSQATAELKMTGGTTVCNGSYFFRFGLDANGNAISDEAHVFTWNFTNYNDDVTIHFDRVRVFTADGSMVVDYPSANFPEPPPGTKKKLEAHQSTQVRSHDVFGGPTGFLGKDKRPVELVVDWSVQDGVRGYALDGETISEIRYGGIGGKVVARNSLKCRLIRSEWR